MTDRRYVELMERRIEILEKATGIDLRVCEHGIHAFDYERWMGQAGFDLPQIQAIQESNGVGHTPLLELKNLTRLVRTLAPPGCGARLFLKDEACNPAGSSKDRPASVSAAYARQRGYHGIVVATQGNYGVSLASQAAVHDLRAIILQEACDSEGSVPPELEEKTRKCEALGAEVMQTTVGPELTFLVLDALEQTGYFYASFYTPIAVTGNETLGLEIAQQVREKTGRDPDGVVVGLAGGANLTGLARGLRTVGAYRTSVIGVTVDMGGLQIDSDRDFRLPSFTPYHSGIALPQAACPDQADILRSAARPLRYMDELLCVTQGEILYVTEALRHLEGLERGVGGNAALTAAVVLAQRMGADEILVVGESEYAGVVNTPAAQIAFEEELGVRVETGDPRASGSRHTLIIPDHPGRLCARAMDLNHLRRAYVRRALQSTGSDPVTEADVRFLAEETRTSSEWVRSMIAQYQRGRPANPP